MRITVVLTVVVSVLGGMAISGLRPVQAGTGWRIDAFTLKDTYNGIGADVPSDAFSPEEDMQIYAKLTYNEFPVSRYLIAFEISSPPNPIQNITRLYTGQTNDSGIAKTPTFRETTFGEWTVLATVQVASEVTINDSLTFKFNWIVQAISLTTANESFMNQTTFPRGSNIIIEVNLLNIAMSDKNTILSLEIFDSLGLNINSEKTYLSVLANETLTPWHFPLHIPENATNGIANIYVNAYKAAFDSGGIPYCPQLSSSFLIMHRNVAILQVKPSSLLAYKNESVSIDVKVRNEGDISESFNVTICRNDTAIAVVPVTNLPPYSERILTAIWNTNQTEEGRYLIMANISSALEGDDPFDNTVTDGIVEVIQRRLDIETTSATPLSYAMYALLTVAILLLIIMLYRRSRREKERSATNSFDSGWTAWYYGYSLQRKQLHKLYKARARSTNGARGHDNITLSRKTAVRKRNPKRAFNLATNISRKDPYPF